MFPESNDALMLTANEALMLYVVVAVGLAFFGFCAFLSASINEPYGPRRAAATLALGAVFVALWPLVLPVWLIGALVRDSWLLAPTSENEE